MEIVKSLKNSHYSPTLEIGGTGAKIIGRAVSYQIKTSALKRDNGEESVYAKFEGDFLCILPDGSKIRSNIMYAPEILENPIKNAIDNARHDENGEVNSVEFGFEVFKRDDRANTKNPRGFVWGLKSLTPAKAETDPLLLLATSISKEVEG